jgi:hypothetical protein
MNLNVRKIIIIIYILIIMSGFIPKRVRNARMQTKTDQPGLKMQGNPAAIGRNSVLTRYINKRVQTTWGLCGRPGDMGFRCRYGVDPSTAGKDALMKYCEFCATPDRFCLNEAPKHQGMAGGVGRVNAPGFKCNGCGALSSGRFIHPHFRPGPGPGPPHPPPPQPQSGPYMPFSVTMQHYGLKNGGSAKITTEVGDPTKFIKYCNDYISFIQKLTKSVYVDRVQFCINGNPGPGKPGGEPSRVNYSTLVNADGSKKDSNNNYPWVYEHFIKKLIIKQSMPGWLGAKNIDSDGNRKYIRMGFTFDCLEPWNCFLRNADNTTGKLVINTETLQSNYDANKANDNFPPPCGHGPGIGWPESCGGTSGPTKPYPIIHNPKNDIDKNGSINQTFAYVAHINQLISLDTEITSLPLYTPTNKSYYFITSASYDDEDNSSKYPGTSGPLNNQLETTSTFADKMWKIQNERSSGPSIEDLPAYSATGGMFTNGLDNLQKESKGPGRVYQECYDKGPDVSKQCPYKYGFLNGQKGWDVKGHKSFNFCGTNFTPFKGTSDMNTTASKYYTLANYIEPGKGYPANAPWLYIVPPDGSDPLRFKQKLDNPQWGGTRGTSTVTEFNGNVLMFSIQSITNGAITKSGGGVGASEDCFGSWKYDDFIKYLEQVAKFLGPNGSAVNGYDNPMLAIYEFDFVPDKWKD